MTCFHTDPDVIDSYVEALFTPNVVLAVLNIIAENAPNLTKLNMSDNKLYSVDDLSLFSIKLPNLIALQIGRYRIQAMHLLDCLKAFCLELVLDGNPLCSKHQDSNIYENEVTKRFPKLLKLDIVDLH